MRSFVLGATLSWLAIIPTCAAAQETPQTGEPVVLDLEWTNGLGDVFALIQAARTPGIRLVGVVARGSTPADSGACVAALLELVDRQDVPVVIAAGRGQVPDILLSWAKGFSPARTLSNSPHDLLISLSKSYPRDLSIIASGSLATVGATAKKDPAFLGRLQGIHLPDTTFDGKPDTDLSADLEAARVVVDSTVDLTLYDSSLTRSLNYSRARAHDLGSVRSRLSDQLTRWAAGSGHSSSEPLVFPTSLAVAFVDEQAYHKAQTAHFVLADGALFETAEMGARALRIVTGTEPEALFREFRQRIGDMNLDFGTSFAHMVFSFQKLQPASLDRVRERLGEGVPVPETEGVLGSDALRMQLLAYYAQFIQLLDELDDGDPEARRILENLVSAYELAAGFGWWFPDAFYDAWQLETLPGESFTTQVGFSNPHGELLTNVQLSLELGGAAHSLSIDSTTADAKFTFVIDDPAKLVPRPETVKLTGSFTCRDYVFKRTETIPLVYGPVHRFSWIRPGTETVTAAVFSAELFESTPALVFMATDSDAGRGFSEVARQSVDLATGEQVVTATIPRSVTSDWELLRVALVVGESTPAETYAVLPPTDSKFLPTPQGPGARHAVTVEREGKWGWATAEANGVDAIEYVALPASEVQEASGPLRITIEYFNEGDETDTFRIEAATESAVFQPVTPWVRKPFARHWRADKFAVSPLTEPIFRSGSVRWLRVASGGDGDEIVRSIAVGPDTAVDKP